MDDAGAVRREGGASDGPATAAPLPGAPLELLDAARDAVRPRVTSACFAHRSVGEQLRQELQVRGQAAEALLCKRVACAV